MLPFQHVPRYRFHEFTLSTSRRLLVRGGHELPLIPRYFDLLVFLLERRHEAVHRRQIFDRVWNDVIVSDSALSQAIRTLRRTLGDDPREPRFIRTISRHGYQFVCDGVLVEDDVDVDAATPAPGVAPGVAEPAAVSAPMPQLIASRLRQAIGGTPTEWAAAALGAGLAGVVGGAAGGLLLTLAPGSSAPAAVIPVMAVVGGACGAIGGAGVGAGLSVGEASTRSKRRAAEIIGAAAGGALVGATVQWLARWSLATLVGLTVGIGGALEGLIIGTAAGLGYAVATARHDGSGRGLIQAAACVAGACALGALALTALGRPLVGGTLHAIAKEASGSPITLAPLGRLIGEPDFGPVTQRLIGTGEGLLFGLGLAFGLFYRRSSPTSHQTVTAR